MAVQPPHHDLPWARRRIRRRGPAAVDASFGPGGARRAYDRIFQRPRRPAHSDADRLAELEAGCIKAKQRPGDAIGRGHTRWLIRAGGWRYLPDGKWNDLSQRA